MMECGSPWAARFNQTQPGREWVWTNTAVFRPHRCLRLFSQHLCFENSFLLEMQPLLCSELMCVVGKSYSISISEILRNWLSCTLKAMFFFFFFLLLATPIFSGFKLLYSGRDNRGKSSDPFACKCFSLVRNI